jgi:hypothetical protein
LPLSLSLRGRGARRARGKLESGSQW